MFPNSVVDADGCMEKFADAWSPGHRNANAGEGLKKLDVVQEGNAKPVGGIGIVGADVIENDLKID